MLETLDLLRRNPVRSAAIAIVLAIVIGVFAYAAGCIRGGVSDHAIWIGALTAYLAVLLFAVFVAHLGAALFHALIRRDSVLQSMV